MRRQVVCLIFIFTFIVAIMPSCDEVDNPYPAFGGFIDPDLGISQNEVQFIQWDTTLISSTDQSKRNIVLEEFTGHTCIFCPFGTRKIIELDAIYDEQLIPVAIHSGGFAEPENNPDGSFSTDFRVGVEGETYLNTFNPNRAYPRGVISRLDNQALGASQWDPKIGLIIDESPVITLGLQTWYDDSLDAVRAKVDYNWVASVTGPYNLQIYVVEDHIIDWQKDGAEKVKEYDHRHVLRKVVNTTWGIEITIDGASSGDAGSFEYVFSLNPEWNADEIDVVIFAFKNDPESYDIIQATEAHIK